MYLCQKPIVDNPLIVGDWPYYILFVNLIALVNFWLLYQPIKLFKKYRKANLINSFINTNPNIRALIADHWKSLELIKTENFKKIKTFCLLHSKEINHEVGSSLNKRLIKSTNNADFIIANSNFTKQLAIKVGIDPSKINIIFPGIPKPK